MSGQYYHTKESIEEYISLATGYDGRSLIKHLNNYLPDGSTVLELGSGPGKDIELLSEHYVVTGSDYSQEFLERLKTIFPDKTLLYLNAADLITDLTFDGIYSNKVLHHLKNNELKQSLQKQYELLNEGGVICHSFWNGQGEEDYNGMYVNNHTEEDLLNFIKPHFEVLMMFSYQEMDKNDSILLIAQKRKAA